MEGYVRRGINDVGRGVIDPLDVGWLHGGKVIVSKGENVVGMQFVQAPNVDLVILRFLQWIFVVDGGDEGGIGLVR